jgi:hypothetical protein
MLVNEKFPKLIFQGIFPLIRANPGRVKHGSPLQTSQDQLTKEEILQSASELDIMVRRPPALFLSVVPYRIGLLREFWIIGEFFLESILFQLAFLLINTVKFRKSKPL